MFSEIFKIAMNNKMTTFSLFLTGLLIFTSGCGKNGTSPIATLVNNVSLTSFTQNNDQWVQVGVQLTTGGFSLAGINLPVVNPNNPSETYGDISLIPTLCTATPCNNGGQLSVSVDLTQATQAQGVSTSLPNGTLIPVSGINGANLIALPIAQTGAKIYLAFGPGVAIFGTALPFAALDPAGKYLPGVDIFEPLTFDKVSLIAGIFAGANTDTTGVGLFVDLSSVLNPASIIPTARNLASAHSAAPVTPNRVTFAAVKPSATVERNFYQKLYGLSKRGLTLKMQ